MSDELTVRPATPEDASEVFALLQQLAARYQPQRTVFDRHYPMLLASDQAAFLVAVEGRRVVGYVMAYETPTLYANGPVTMLLELIVDPESRDLGIGRRLVKSVIDWARSRNAVEVALATRRAGEYYQRLGFDKIAEYYTLKLG